MLFKDVLVHFFLPSILLFGALTYLYGFLVMWSLMAVGSRFLALAGAPGSISYARCSTTVIHLPLDGVSVDNGTYSVVNPNDELHESIYHDPALQFICFFARSIADWIEKLYRYSLLQNLSMVLSDHAGTILTTLAFYFGFPSSLAKEPPAKSSTKIQKQQPKSRAKSKGSATNQSKGKAPSALKTPTEGPEDSEQSGDDNEDSDKGENPRGGPHADDQVIACPFYKLDPITHYLCVAKYKFTAFNRLKQHMKRNHSLKEFYCPLCWEIFLTAAKRDHHIRQERCQSRPFPEFMLFTDDEIHQLEHTVPGKSSDQEKYFWLWDTFFKAHPRPKSPYVVEGIFEPFGLLVEVAKRNAATGEFSNWLQDQFYPPWEDVLRQLLTLRHERTQISRRVPIQSLGDPSHLVKDDAHLTVLESEPPESNRIGYAAHIWSDFPAMDLDDNMRNSSIPSGFHDIENPGSCSSANATSLSNDWNAVVENIAHKKAPRSIAPSDMPRLFEMKDLIDLDGGSEQRGPKH
ncbi:hypothetical protein CSAL01_08012 [Colletotrichum salicis]|uniref:C2H2-type domain-containing protein n=1 Tax=Colletotrichum salicis TaxID=1209931 RepID=A0A135S4Z9_9PEZI|nr:hypothetical protein CSAL01_08012 [Colletotrichum salicis]